MVDKGRDLDYGARLLTYEEFVDLSICGGVRSRVVESYLKHAVDACEIVCLLPMTVPSFDDSRVGGCDIGLTELLEDVPVASEDFDEPTSFIMNRLELSYSYPLN